ncbi:MAG: MarR family transcriptional regulator [Candidatus Nanopelagicales bacterium]|nr:MarR family transcriptional regulator [Candidatus Nanopelagicales bacterium]MDZ4250709.1 MarR family transcriptional regulator [Candidatus Nanopelagicales bacterium]
MNGRLPLDPIAEARRNWVEHGWTEAAEGMVAVTSIMRAQQILLARVDAALREHSLTFARYETLMLLRFSKTGALPMRVIGSRLQVHPTSVTNAVDRLEKDGFVRRDPHPSDRRAVLVSLTPSGREAAEAATRQVNAQVFSGIGLTDAELADLTRALDKLRQSAGDF